MDKSGIPNEEDGDVGEKDPDQENETALLSAEDSESSDQESSSPSRSGDSDGDETEAEDIDYVPENDNWDTSSLDSERCETCRIA